MSQFKIERNVPLPGEKNRGRKRIYPWAEMKVGDSILINGPARYSAYSSAFHYGRVNGCEFTRREEGSDSFRIWRKA